MSARGSATRRGRPPKTPSMERHGSSAGTSSKFQYHLMKKPKYLLNRGSDSQLSTPTPSRASSPHGSTDSSRPSMPRPSTSRLSVTGGSARKGRAAAAVTPVASGKRGKAAQSATPYSKKEYMYGSDFGESSDEADADDDMLASQSESDSLIGDDAASESDFSLSSFSSCTQQQQKRQRQPTPEPLWLQQRDIPRLDLPATSEDLLIPLRYTLRTAAVYEIMRRFKYLMRLTPFRLEDLCAALACPDQSALLVEVHIALMKAILREEDTQATHFGPLDQKDSVNISLYLCDAVTWPEILRSYVDSDAANDRGVLDILSNTEYPYTTVDNRLRVLQFLTDQFLVTAAVRDDICKEGPIHYDDHCRICHRLGDLLCCETCPAVFHLECVDPPLVDVPTEDWQCSICKAHQISGVYDCISVQEKQGMLSRHDQLGFDRHGRKYWFISRRIFVETDDGADIWYYSTVDQLEQLLTRLDDSEMEAELCAELTDLKEEIVRQMEITEQLTEEQRGQKRSYLDVENAKIRAALKKTVEGDSMAISSDVEMRDADAGSKTSGDDSKCDSEKVDVEGDSDSSATNARHTTRLKTGTLVQKSYVDEKKIKAATPIVTSSLVAEAKPAAMPAVASTPISTAALFRLGQENNFKTYSNQFTTSPIALNKPQRNEERDKKRHLSHKFSLTTASEFKWTGATLTGSQVSLVAGLRSTLLSLEQTVSSTYMHPNWSSVRKQWVTAVTSSSRPIDFAKVMVILLTCFKAPLFANVWHEQLGHVKLQRITAAEREDKKKLEKREKREKDDEEERNRLSVNFVKYSLGLKHQVWKQKGEEYRIHGQWGWVWMSYGRRPLPRKLNPEATPSERINTHKVMVPIERAGIRTIIGIRASTYEYLRECRVKLETGVSNDDPAALVLPEDIRNVRLVATIDSFAELDVSKALAAPGRLLYPRQAKKSKLDDLLAHRVALRDAEELKLKEMKPEPQPAEAGTDGSKSSTAKPPVVQLLPPAKVYSQTSIEKQLMKIITHRSAAAAAAVQPSALANIDMNFVSELAKSIQAARHQFGQLSRVGKNYRCYSRECNNHSATVFALPQTTAVNCYSPLCMQKSRVKRELLSLLRKAHTAGNGSKETVSAIMAIVNRKPTLLEQKLNEQRAADLRAATGDTARADDPAKMLKDFREACTISFAYEEEDVIDCISMTATVAPAEPMCTDDSSVKAEVKDENTLAEAAIVKAESDTIDQQEPMIFDDADQHGSSVAEVEVGDTVSKDDSCEIKLDNELATPDAKRRRINTTTSEVSSTIEIPSDDDDDTPLTMHRQQQLLPDSQQSNEDTRKSRRRKSPRNVRSTRSLTTTTTTHTRRTTTEYDDGSVEEESNSSTKTRSRESATDGKRNVTTLTQRQSIGQSKYVAHPNRRFAATASKTVKKEEQTQIVSEFGANGSERVYTVSRSAGRLYLKKTLTDGEMPAARVAVHKLPVINSYLTRRSTRSLMVLPRHDLIKMARCGGKYSLVGYHPLAKTNNGSWPYPSSRPQFKTAWFYRTMTMRTLAAVALQLRIVWCCLRWDDMSTKPPTNDGKHQVTTETEIMSLEILKYRHCGRFSERTQYLRRKVVIPLELPKTIREFTSIRSGLRKRKRAESPQKTDPQVSEEWVDEDKLELWEIKQFGEKQERANIALQPITRTSTGKLPTTRTPSSASQSGDNGAASTSGSGGSQKVLVSSKATPEEIKEKMEQQLRIQRAAHHQKRALEMKNVGASELATSTAASITDFGSVLVAAPHLRQHHQHSPLQPTTTVMVVREEGADDNFKELIEARPANSPVGDKPHIIGQRKVVVKNADGTTKIIQQNIPAPILKATDSTSGTASPGAPNSTAQKVQIIRGPDGKVSVRGLNPGQQLIQMPDGKLHVLTSGQASAALASGQAKTVIRSTATGSPTVGVSAASPKTLVKTTASGGTMVASGGIGGTPKQVIVRQQIIKGGSTGAPIVLNKAAPKTGTLLTQQRVIVTSNQQLQPIKVGGPLVSSTSAQKTITTKSGQILNAQPVVQKVIQTPGGSTNLQQLLQQGGQSGQKIVIGQAATPNRVVVTKQVTQNIQSPVTQNIQPQQLVQVQQPQVMQQHQQQQQMVVNSGQKILQQYVNESNQQQQIIVNGQRILLAPGQRIITQQQPAAQQQQQQQVVQQQQLVQQVIQQQPQQQQQVIQQIVQQQPQQPSPQQQQQIVVQQQQAAPATQQLITNNSSLAQQLAQGKLQVATVNGQQVIIKPLGNNQAQIVAHIKTQNDGQAHIVTSSSPAVSGANDQLPDSTTEVVQQQQLQQQQQQQQQFQPQQQQQQVLMSPSTNANSVPASTSAASRLEPNIEQSLLQGQPPGTVIKCVTAQVIQTPQGPRIVLQGLAGNDFTQQQLALVQQQVKQQLLKAQETSGKTGVLGPTKIYLAVQPAAGQIVVSGTTAATTNTTQPPPLTPVQSPQQQVQSSGSAHTILATAVETTSSTSTAISAMATTGKFVKVVTNGTTTPIIVGAAARPGNIAAAPAAAAAVTVPVTTTTQSAMVAVEAAPSSTTTPAKFIVCSATPTPTTIITTSAATTTVDVKNQLAQKVLANKLKTDISNSITTDDKNAKDDSFVVTPDYIQQTIKNALKQENLNPEIEEKLLNLQRYQEKQMKSDDVQCVAAGNSSRHHTAGTSSSSSAAANHSQSNSGSPSVKPPGNGHSSRKRPNQRSPLDDDDWVLDTPKRRPPAGSGTSANNVAAANSNDRTPGSTSATPTKKSDASTGSAETSPTTPAAPVNKRSLAAKKRESDKKKAALAAQIELLRNKDHLKRAILKKRVLLETELQMEVHRELKSEQAIVSARAIANNAATTVSTALTTPAKKSITASAASITAASPKAAMSPRKSSGMLNKELSKLPSTAATATAATPAVGTPVSAVVSSTTVSALTPPATQVEDTPQVDETSPPAKATAAVAKDAALPKEPVPVAPAAQAKNSLTPANPDKRRPVPTHKTTIKTNKPDNSTPHRGGGRRPNRLAGPKPSSRKKEKLFCLCRTPYDDSKFYVGCDLCNNWFHGECVGISENGSKQLSEFVCGECKHARDTQELYCLCRKPYDESQFYICCDKCQDWFHGRCVGIVQSEADSIDEYICPKCQQNDAASSANMKDLTTAEYEQLRKMIKLIQAHKSAWPFMEPVDADEAPDYYRVIKDPMDLQKIEHKITAQDYVKLSEFIGDMTKIFDNCRFYNSKESSFYRCAESLEGYFVQRIKHLRETLAAQKPTELASAVVGTKATVQTSSAETKAALDVNMEDDEEDADEGMDEKVEINHTERTTTAATTTTTTTAARAGI